MIIKFALCMLCMSFVCRSFSKSIMPLEAAKKLAAYTAVDKHIKDNYIIGLGSGSTVIYVAERLAQVVKENNYNVKCVPTSFQARQLIIKHKLSLTDLDINPQLDICIDGADEVDSNLNLIKGGGGCLLQEKIVASCAKELIIVADHTKNSQTLGEQYKKGIPIEVIPMAFVPIQKNIEQTFGGTLQLRMGKAKAGPAITDNGNFVLDWIDFKPNQNWTEVNTKITLIPGVVETGLFIKMAKKAYFGMSDGSVKEQE